MNPREQHNALLAAQVIRHLEKRNFEAWYVPTAAQAVDKVKELIPRGAEVAWGGSMSLNETGILDYLKGGDFTLIDREGASDAAEARKAALRAFSCDWYLTSVNAISQNGILYNIDGTGNRVAALIFGPENVLVVAGLNKIAPSEEAALNRVKNLAAPLNALRLNKKTPCVKTGVCADCLVDDCICSHTLLTRRSRPKGRIRILLVGESLGY